MLSIRRALCNHLIHMFCISSGGLCQQKKNLNNNVRDQSSIAAFHHCNPQASPLFESRLTLGVQFSGEVSLPNIFCQLRPSDHSGSVRVRSTKQNAHTFLSSRLDQHSVLKAAAKSSDIWRRSKQKSINKPCDQFIVTRDTFFWSFTHV